MTKKDKRYRLCVNKTNKNLYVQIIDDTNGTTLVAGSTLYSSDNCNIKMADDLGQKLLKVIKEKKIEKVYLDRRSHPYMGQIKAISDRLRDVLDF